MKALFTARLPKTLWLAIALIGLHFLCAQVLARVHLLEHLLSPGSDSFEALVILACFFLFRLSVLVLLPAWLIAKLWLWWSRPCADGS